MTGLAGPKLQPRSAPRAFSLCTPARSGGPTAGWRGSATSPRPGRHRGPWNAPQAVTIADTTAVNTQTAAAYSGCPVRPASSLRATL
jgi:hypothetical protein